MTGTLRALGAALVSLLVAMAAPATANAADSAATLAALRQEQVAIYAIVREFHMLTLLSGDPARNAQLKVAIDKAGAATDTLKPGSGNAALDAALQKVAPEWKAFARLAGSNNIGKDGYTDDNLVGDLYAGADSLNKAVAAAIAAIPGGTERARADKAHAANLMMQRTAAAYLKRAAQMSPDVGAQDDFDIGEATRALDQQIQKLAVDMPGDPVMRGVLSKWNFIRASMLNYNEKSVPFIVDRYAAQMDDGLQTVVRQLSGGK